jgi:4-hydroxy-tetrahydrodipicolinate synthase
MKDGEVSYGDLENLISKQIDGNVSGLVPCGTTGESPTLCKDEHLEVIRQTIGMVNGKVPVIAGTGANSTQEALFLTENADQAGADAFLIVAPYYNKPSQEGLFAHFSAIAKRTEKPIVLYSIPSRCGIEISTDTVKRLRENHPHICALKEAGGRSSKVSETVVALDSDFTVLSGDDGLTLPFMSCGAKGVVSVASNLIPQKVVSLVSLALEGKFIDAQKVHLEYYNFFTDIFCEPNPVPIKTLLHLKNVISSAEVRLPLSPVSDSNKQMLEKIASDL